MHILENPKFSLILPTRNRPEKLSNFLRSVSDTVACPEEIEVILGVDTDDMNLRKYVDLARTYENLNVQIYLRPRSPNISNDYINKMARMSRGHIIWVFNDDAEILTKSWDLLLVGEIMKSRKIQEDAFYVDTYDSTRNFENNGQFACFPAISRNMFETLGYFFHPLCFAWGADKWLHLVANEAGCVLSVQGVEIQHHRDCSDEQHINMSNVSKKYGFGADLDYSKDIEKLKKVVEVQRNAS